MSGLSEVEQAVGKHYDELAYDVELTRLEDRQPVERAMTERYIARFVPDRAVVADVGVGAGHYDEALAVRGCRLHLVDVSKRLLAAALARLEGKGLSGQVLSANIASATDLSHLPDGSCDAILMLGPLYHLLTLSERESAVAEAARLLKPNGVLLAAACNRMMALATDFYSEPERGADTLTANHRLVVDGILNPDLAPTIGHSYFTNVRDFRSLFEKAFDELLLVGVESFAGNHQGLFLGLSRAAQDAWLDLIEVTAAQPEAMGLSEHFLFVGRPCVSEHRRPFVDGGLKGKS